jgi:Flp pilus assembly pilin Flp
MNSLFANWYADESGFVISAELILIVTVMVLGIITGMACVQGAIVQEFRDIGAAIRSLDQTYFVSGYRGCLKVTGRTSFTASSGFFNNQIDCDYREIVGGSVISSPVLVSPPVINAPLAAPVLPCPTGISPIPAQQPVLEMVPGRPLPAGTSICPTNDCETGSPVHSSPARAPELPFSPAPQVSPQL